MPAVMPRWAGMEPSSASAAPTRRPDASMTLLREVMERPLDPGYAEAAARPARRGPRVLAVTLLLATLAGYLTVTAVGRLRLPAGQAGGARERLQQEIETRTAAVDRRRRANQELQVRNAAAQAAALGAGPGAALTADLQRLQLSTGETPVTGPGVRYVLGDAPNAAADGRVLDRDLQVVVNGLWAAGAEAMAVNGQRLTALSAIRSAGDAILVDYRPLSPPYVITAIGDPSALQAGFAAGDAGTYMQSLRNNYGVTISVRAERRLTLPGAGLLVLRVVEPAATPVAEPGATP